MATAIAGTAATVVAVLINGREIIRTIIERPEDPPGSQKYYALQVTTRDEQGSTKTDLSTTVADALFLDAWIEAQGEGANPADGGPINIAISSGADKVQMSEYQATANGRTVLIQTAGGDTSGTDGVLIVEVSAPLAGNPMTAPVRINLYAAKFTMVFEDAGPGTGV